MSDIDSAVSNVELMDGSCNAGEALYQCGSALFSGDAAGRKRVLIVLMAGKSQETDIGNAAGSLKTAGVKIVVVGMGGSFDKSQISALSSSSSHVLTAASFNGLAAISGSLSTLVSQAGGISSSGTTPGAGGGLVSSCF
ncbi:hypothetical protein OS493_013827 [Desmophyllum pertusum]|uniref:VWFA domain-containing protein n=1 Tax=Desmophyllum pertusum TaxID=174260 RepID=A0A9W9ZRU2_9CNID|nr:hypothetical protein OS493_013827 [Desmophyllum pertusum]